jgi:Flp pilus assembly protein TadB
MPIDESKYTQELEDELGNNSTPMEQIKTNYSNEYQQFLNEQTSTSRSFYSRACQFSSKILHIPIKKQDYDKINRYINLLHLNVKPQAVLSFAYLSAILIVILSVVFTVVFLSFYPIMIGLVGAVASIFVLSNVPKYMFKLWRSKASDQLVNAILYMVIYLEHTSNLEQAVYFAAKNLPPPLSLDFIRALWMVESGKYSTISESLEDYVKIWQDWNESFVESMHMLESSLFVGSEERRQETLSRTIDIILDGTKHNLMKYAHDIQNPVQAIHMLGIILPVMGLVMLPMLVSFMGDVVKIWQVFLFYNILLPITVFLLAKNTLDSRPAGVNSSDIYAFQENMDYNTTINVGNHEIKVSPRFVSGLVFAIFVVPAVLYFFNLYTNPPENIIVVANNMITLTMSLLIVLGVGLSLGVYYHLISKDLIKKQEFLNKIDKEFANGIFQLGNRLEEGIPVESAFKKVADIMPQSPIASVFNNIYNNLINNQQDLRAAIFDENIGAVSKINSTVIRGVMNIVVEASKKGSKVVAFSLITISRFLNSVRNVNERLNDLLAETIASLKSEVKIFIPMISGIVVAMAVLTTNILVNLSDKLHDISNIGTGSEEQLGFGSTLLDIFKINYLIPSWMFQLVVGLYLIEVTILMSYLLSGITYGPQKVERDNLMKTNLFIGVTLYCVLTLIMSAFFMTMTQGIGANL